MKVHEIKHPDYLAEINDWVKFRLTYNGGDAFVDEYLEQFSASEDYNEFEQRKRLTYRPNHAKRAVDKIKNSIYQRLVDINRIGGSPNYQDCMGGKNGGVDRHGLTMNEFINTVVLPELLTMRKVYVYVDMPPLTNGSVAEASGKSPYLYVFRAENMLSWIKSEKGETSDFTAAFVKEYGFEFDQETGLPKGTVERYRYLQLTKSGVQVTLFDKDGVKTGNTMLDLTRIPLVEVSLTSSLLSDICEHQIALLNLASSDIAYLLVCNIPTYTEQFNPRFDTAGRPPTSDADATTAGSATEARKAITKQLVLGHRHGRQYPIGTERPAFINPSTDPVEISMKKQGQIVEDIEKLVDLKVEQFALTGEAKKQDVTRLEAGLSYIGSVLEIAENKISSLWSEYEGSKTSAVITYPLDYSLKTDNERLEEAKKQKEVKNVIPSNTFQREMCKKMARTLLGARVSEKTLKDIEGEIENSTYLLSDPNDLKIAQEMGAATADTCSIAMGFAPGEAAKAQTEKAERLKMMQESQMKTNMSARGLDTNHTEAEEEKKIAKEPDLKKETE